MGQFQNGKTFFYDLDIILIDLTMSPE